MNSYIKDLKKRSFLHASQPLPRCFQRVGAARAVMLHIMLFGLHWEAFPVHLWHDSIYYFSFPLRSCMIKNLSVLTAYYLHKSQRQAQHLGCSSAYKIRHDYIKSVGNSTSPSLRMPKSEQHHGSQASTRSFQRAISKISPIKLRKKYGNRSAASKPEVEVQAVFTNCEPSDRDQKVSTNPWRPSCTGSPTKQQRDTWLRGNHR